MDIFNLMVSINRISRRLGFLCIVFLSIAVYSQSVPQPGQLIAYYPFSGNVNDSGGNNYDGTISGGAALTTDRFGNNNSAYALDGVDGYIYFGDAMYTDFPATNAEGYYDDDFSISIWAKSSVNAEEALIAFGVNDGLYTGMISRIGDNMDFNSFNWGFKPTASTSGRKSDGLWHQYVLVYSAESFREIFIDGSLVEQDPGSEHLFNFKTYGVSIGKERYTPDGPGDLANTYTGSVDDVRIWNVALTRDEVSSLYNYDNIAHIAPTITNFNSITKTYFDASYTMAAPTSNSTGAFTYTSNNPAVATISGTTVTINGTGAATITAAQAGNATYASGSVSSTLAVNSVPIVTKNGEFSTTNFNYVNKNGAVGSDFGVNKNGLAIQTKSYDIITTGLVMHLDAGNATSYPGTGTNWMDLSGNGNHGSLQNGVTYNSANNGSLVFDGANDYFVTDANLDLSDTDKLTIQLILKTTASASERMIMEHSVNWNSNNSFGTLARSSGNMQFTDHNQGYNVSNTPETITDNNWHHYSITSDRSLGATNQNLIYIDGNASSVENIYINDNSGNYSNLPLYISSRAGTNYFFNGNIAQVLIYKRVLTAEEIQQNFNAVKLKYGL
jgi:hypothetical protein